jgi:hypothetical protein
MILPAMRNGTLTLSHDAWFLRVYVGHKTRRDKKTGKLILDAKTGKAKRFAVQRAFHLGPKRQFMNKRQVREAADRKMLELQMVSTGSMARISLDQFIEHWYLKVADGRLRQSTAKGYRWMWERYIKGRTETKRPLWEYRTKDIQQLLYAINTDNELSKESLKHIKAFLSGVFKHAVAVGFRDGNPVRDTLLPKSSKPPRTPGVYTLAEIETALGALTGPAKCAVAIAAFAGLRLAEIQGLTWDAYNVQEGALGSPADSLEELRQSTQERSLEELGAGHSATRNTAC